MAAFTLMMSHILILEKSGSPEQEFWLADRSTGLGKIRAKEGW